MSESDRHDPFAPAKRVIKGSLDFKGRSQRSDGVYYYFLTVLVAVVIYFAIGVFGLSQLQDGVGFLVSISQLPLIAWLVRRLHDQGRSGWFILIWPAAGLTNYLLEEGETVHTAIMLVLFLSALAMIFWPPTKGPNRYGPDPRTSIEPLQKV